MAEMKYDLVILGATGYTGKLAAEYMQTEGIPPGVKWAIAGRSKTKLEELASRLHSNDEKRNAPAIEIVNLNIDDLRRLAKMTRIIINTIGPYHLYSSPVVQACAEAGTHYLDVTGETPWIREMIQKFDHLAKKNNAILIPSLGMESVPSDVLTWLLVETMRVRCHVPTKSVVASLYNLKSLPSGGTLATALGLLDHYSIGEVSGSTSGNWSSSPVQGAKDQISQLQKMLGVFSFPFLGTVSTCPMTAGPNVAVVQRSWGLRQQMPDMPSYGANFTYREYVSVRNRIFGFALHVACIIAMLLMAIPVIRWTLQRLVMFAPGQGPSKHDSKDDYVEYRALAVGDDRDQTSPSSSPRMIGTFAHKGSMYYLTGILVVNAAMTLLQNDDKDRMLKGGMLTPSMLGQPYVDRLRNAGVDLFVQRLE